MDLKTLLLSCFDVLITLIVVPPLLLVLSPIWLYKHSVRLLAKILHPDYVALSKNDPFTVWDIIYPRNGRHVYSVGVAVRINGIVTLQRVQQRISAEVLCETENGGKLHPRLYEEFVLFGGYAFRKPLKKMDISLQIRQKNLETETLAAFKARWIEMPYLKGAAPWEVMLVPQGEVGETILLMKIHHALADGYSLLHIFNSFLDNQLPKLPPEPEDSFWERTKQFFSAIRITTMFNAKVFSTARNQPWKVPRNDAPSLVASTSLYFPDLKLIHRKTETHYTSIMLAIFGGVLNRVLTEESSNPKSFSENENRGTVVQLSFAWPNHPLSTLCNHWTSGGIRVPLNQMKSLERLKEVEKDYNAFMDSEMHKILKRFIFPIGGLLPVKLFWRGFEFSRKISGLRTLFTFVMAFSEDYYVLDGNPIISVSPLDGILGSTTVISGLGFSYKDQVQCTFIASSELAKDQETMDRIVKNYLVEEVENFVQELEEEP